jgi:hypothetical protein
MYVKEIYKSGNVVGITAVARLRNTFFEEGFLK